ncbi:coniferyl-aldehyde dehydrogenase [Paraburkholderia steynii]|uniref:Aldehyde dehydrogenase n=1 Tax=Paraburkholderia steynii TaxID=1245441 RepID=A0A7Z7BM66_9BURK|nr:coniferyl aldehyde dehydrogenase [Paraburkholderia steynii]SDJ56617.1 coniferyl-aldehyde dehydrogenase [Paraburkholderia steynii]
MNASLDPAIATQSKGEMHSLFEQQRAAVARIGSPSFEQRVAALDALANMVKTHRHELVQAISSDFGNRAKEETELGELMPILNGIKHVRKHLKSWMRPERRKVGIAFRPASAQILYQPLGVVGILAPWNYPLTLTLAPLTEALAAGNCVMVKPSELTPRTAALLQKLIAATFSADQVTVVTGGPEIAANFCALPFDHLLFTGSTRVGKHVMAAAAPNLTPVTLELGGKSPVVLCRGYPLKKAARIVAIGKFFNAGQTCVAPDYMLVPRELVDTFAETILDVAQELYPSIAGNRNYTSIVSDQHCNRLMCMIQEARERGATIRQLSGAGAIAERKIPPTVITGISAESAVMQEEIFGPLLPVIPYDTLDDAIAFINRRPKPLALYCFSIRSTDVESLLARTRSGGVTINGTMLHATQEDLPFGGVGESGMGAYHGRDGFVRLSQARGVMKLSRFNMSDRIAAPYGRMTRFVVRLMLGK